MISETSLLTLSNALWKLIEVPESNLTPRGYTAVSPINDTDIAILGGRIKTGYLDDVLLFNTTTQQCKKVAESKYRFYAYGNQCA